LLGCPWEVIQSIKELATDPQAIADGYLCNVQVEDSTDITVVAGPASFNGSAVPHNPRCSPGFGEHSNEVLRSIGVSEDILEDNRRRNIETG
jgi:crotonobetainyl-CoA:carnitine CoA-transferase CaiB-like acyl-CoA transferase